MIIEEICEEARARYPIGSSFIDLVNKSKFTVKSHTFDTFGSAGQLYISVEPHATKPNKTARIYYNGKWAVNIFNSNPTKEISMDEIMQECKRRFPIGCEYISATDDGVIIHKLKDTFTTYHVSDKKVYAHCGAGFLYYNGKYATIINSKENLTAAPEISLIHNGINLIEEISFNRIGTKIKNNIVQLNNLIEEVSFKRIKSNK